MTALNRRSLAFGLVAALPATAAPAALAASPDPIFGLIEEHRLLAPRIAEARARRAASEAVIPKLEEYIDPAQPSNWGLACGRRRAANPEFADAVGALSGLLEAEFTLERAILSTVPTTTAGAAALCRYFVERFDTDFSVSQFDLANCGLSEEEGMIQAMSNIARALS